jgi:CBS-domain-containing membrane protein
VKHLSHGGLTPKRAAIVAGALALLIGVSVFAREYDVNVAVASLCANNLSFSSLCLPYGNNALLATLQYAAIASVVYFFIIFGILMIARLVWRATIAKRRTSV